MIIFFGDALKKVFQTMLHTIRELKNRIWLEIKEINRNPGMLQFVMNNFLEGSQEIVRFHGEHFIGVIFKT
jgi:hypothetical protein